VALILKLILRQIFLKIMKVVGIKFAEIFEIFEKNLLENIDK
jgi:hypothetical protein